MEFKEHICIVGAGLVGSLISIILANRGFKVDLIEKREDMRSADISGGRTIAMSISHRGWNALAKVGLVEKIKLHTRSKSARMVHLDEEASYTQQYGNGQDAISTINRKFLNISLLNAAEKTGRVILRFNQKCTSINFSSNEINFENTLTKVKTKKKYDKIIGADGIFSAIAQEMSDQKLIDHHMFSPAYGYKELVIPPTSDGNYQLVNNVVHVWPRDKFSLVALPNVDKTFTCTLFLKFNGKYSLSTLTQTGLVKQFFKENFPYIIHKVPDYVDQFLKNPVSNIYSLKSFPWNYKNKILLIGDAGHAIAPFFAMGMNVGFEDCAIFDDLMSIHQNNLDKVFEKFTNSRKEDTDAIADMSLNNFKSLGKSDDPHYNLKWELNRKFWELYPNEWTPLYSMIAFSSIPLSNVKEKSEYQAEIMNYILQNEYPEHLLKNDLNKLFKKYVNNSYLQAV